MPLSIIASIRTDRINALGECNIIIRVLHDTKVLYTKSTGRKILPIHWDLKLRKVKTTYAQYQLYNAAVRKQINEMESALMRYELSGGKMTKLGVTRLLTGKSGVLDFYEYCLEHIPIKYCEARQKETRRSYYGELTKLKKYAPALCFDDINYTFLQSYRAYMLMELHNHPNTVWKSFKFIKTMFNDAIKEDRYTAENPFQKFDAGKYTQGQRNYLELSDCEEIRKVLNTNIPDMIRKVGYYYLFMCYSGLRFSDAMRYDAKLHRLNDCIVMKTQKKQVDVKIFIHQKLHDVLTQVELAPLKICNKEFNKYLKVLATLSGISIPLTAHVGRHTFGALLAEIQTPKEVAMKLLGHKDIRSTNVYYHMKDQALKSCLEKLDAL